MGFHLTEVKISVNALAVGMFVCRLDRPWLDTPLPFQGFKIQNAKDIERVKRYCEHVYVDVEKGTAPNTEQRLAGTPIQTRDEGENEYVRLRKLVYERAHQFEAELSEAEQVHDELSVSICQVMDDLSFGNRLELSDIRTGVKAMLDSVLRNPSAFLWVNRLKKADSYTYSHLIGTSIWCAVFGRHLGLERDQLEELALGGLLIDVGKAKLPVELLKKTERLTEEEFELIKRHVDYGVRILAEAGNISHTVMRMVATHHERWNGRGYPLGLKGNRIPVFGRIAGLIDSFEAMTAPRPFSRGISPHAAISEFYEHRGTVFEPALVEQFIRACGIYPTGSLVELNTGEVAIVVGLESAMRLRPKVMVVLGKDKRPYSEVRAVDLSLVGSELSIRHGLAPGAYGLDIEEIHL